MGFEKVEGNQVDRHERGRLRRECSEVVAVKMELANDLLRFDPSGQYLGAAGQDLRLYMAKTWAEVTCYSSHEVKSQIIHSFNVQF